MKSRKYLASTAASVALIWGMTTTVAIAQDAAAHGFEEIIVTAQKRESTAQKTPVAMTVFGGEALAANGVADLKDLTTLAPSVNLATNSINTIITIRGVSSRDTTEIGDPAVAVSIDGFYIQRMSGLSDLVYDLERAEVLRGPQGTLYGRNATGGAINFITAKPKDEFEASFSVGMGNYDLITTEGMINIPLDEKVLVRASFLTRDRDGYRTNNGAADDGDDADSQSARLHVLFKPTDKLSVLLTGQYTKLGGTGPTYYGLPLGPGGIDPNVMPPLDVKGSPQSLPSSSFDSTTKSIQWTVDYDFDFAKATYLGGYRDLSFSQLRDLDGTPASFFYQPNENPRDWFHEVRLTSQSDGPFEWQVGGFYFKQKSSLLTYFQTYDGPNPPTNLFEFNYPSIQAKAKAVFAQASYEIVEDLKFEAGIRYSEDSKSRFGFADYGGGPIPANEKADSTKTTYHFALNWQATPDNLLYAKYDTGYKAGGFTDVRPYGPENITAYEIGSKNRFFDNTVQLNVTAYYYQYKDQQISQFSDGQTTIFNAGKSEIYGVEIEGSARLTPEHMFDGFIGYMHAEFTEFCTVAGVCPPQNNFAGNRPPQAPRWQMGAGYQYEFPAFAGSIIARAQTRVESSSYLAYTNYAYERQKSYMRSDLMLTYTQGDGDWSIQGYIRNLENTRILTSANGSDFWGTYTFSFADPRTYGVRLSVNW